MPPRTHHAAKRAPGCAAKPEADAARNDQIIDDTEHPAEPILRPFTRGNARQPEKSSRVLPTRPAAAAPLLPGAGELTFTDTGSTQKRACRTPRPDGPRPHQDRGVACGTHGLAQGTHWLIQAQPEQPIPSCQPRSQGPSPRPLREVSISAVPARRTGCRRRAGSTSPNQRPCPVSRPRRPRGRCSAISRQQARCGLAAR